LPPKPLRQWLLSLPFALRFLLATDAQALTGAVTLIQRFGSALNLNIHFHMLFLDGAYLADTSPPVFRCVAPPSERELQVLVCSG